MTTRTELIERLHLEAAFDIHNETKEALNLAADMLEADGKYDQQAMELCEVCGWKAKMDGDPCLVCELPKIGKLREAARLALTALQRGETKLRFDAITAIQEQLA